jgi:hypothetical protein
MPYKPTGRPAGRPRKDGSPPQPSPPPPPYDAETLPTAAITTPMETPTKTPTEPTTPDPTATQTNPDRKTDAERVALWQDQANRARARRLKITPAQLWQRWEDFKKECDKPGRFPTLTGFALSVGQYSGRLEYIAERSTDFATVIEKVKTDQARIAEEHLVSSRFPTGAIFWAKNRLGFRDKSPAEVKESADWLEILAGTKTADRSSSDRADAPPTTDNVLQLVDAEQLAPDIPLDLDDKQASGS